MRRLLIGLAVTAALAALVTAGGCAQSGGPQLRRRNLLGWRLRDGTERAKGRARSADLHAGSGRPHAGLGRHGLAGHACALGAEPERAGLPQLRDGAVGSTSTLRTLTTWSASSRRIAGRREAPATSRSPPRRTAAATWTNVPAPGLTRALRRASTSVRRIRGSSSAPEIASTQRASPSTTRARRAGSSCTCRRTAASTWSAPIALKTETDIDFFNDRNSLAVDDFPASPFYGSVYVGLGPAREQGQRLRVHGRRARRVLARRLPLHERTGRCRPETTSRR